mgnify:CR=1 FL=1
MNLAIGSDHAGFSLKGEIIKKLQEEGHQVIDCGTYSAESVDYPDIAEAVAGRVLQDEIPGILVCGTGIGISIAANKICGIRAAACQDIFSVRLARQHNDANILCVGARITAPELAMEMVETFMKSDFQAGRHTARIEKITQLEKKCRERG